MKDEILKMAKAEQQPKQNRDRIYASTRYILKRIEQKLKEKLSNRFHQ